MNSRTAVVVLIALLSGCAPPTAEQQVIDNAAETMGGAVRIQSVKSLTIHGAGGAPNAGQNRLPDDELPVRKINEYTPPMDLANGRMRVQQMTPSTPRWPARSVRIGDSDGNDIQLNYSR